MRMIRHGQRCLRAVRIVSQQGDVFTFVDDPEAERGQSANDPAFGGVNRKLRHEPRR